MENYEVLVGNKPLSNYVFSILKALEASKKAVVKARGKNISKAVTAVEIVRNKKLANVSVKKISISTVRLKNENGEKSVSQIEIEVGE